MSIYGPEIDNEQHAGHDNEQRVKKIASQYIRDWSLLLDGTTTPWKNIGWGNKKITNLADPSAPQDAATKRYVDNNKTVIAVWAERSGPLRAGRYQWSFGEGRGTSAGYPMVTKGRVLRMGLASHDDGLPPADTKGVYLSISRREEPYYFVSQLAGQFSGTTTLTTPLELDIGDTINFISGTTNESNTNATVCVLVELDM